MPIPSKYTLLYHPGIPGRGEYIRLAFEATSTPYLDPANNSKDKDSAAEVYKLIDSSSTGDSNGNPPPFAPPMLRIEDPDPSNTPLLISQTPNILLYLSKPLGLAGENEQDFWHVNSLTLTALDLSNECHDTHHPVAVMKYYEDQKDEALKKATDFRENRIPKFLGFFERVLKGNEGQGKGRFLVGGKLTVADLTLWQVLDGLSFAFPKEMEARAKELPLITASFRPAIKDIPGIKGYLKSDRRLPYSEGIFRHYPELDRQ